MSRRTDLMKGLSLLVSWAHIPFIKNWPDKSIVLNRAHSCHYFLAYRLIIVCFLLLCLVYTFLSFWNVASVWTNKSILNRMYIFTLCSNQNIVFFCVSCVNIPVIHNCFMSLVSRLVQKFLTFWIALPIPILFGCPLPLAPISYLSSRPFFFCWFITSLKKTKARFLVKMHIHWRDDLAQLYARLPVDLSNTVVSC